VPRLLVEGALVRAANIHNFMGQTLTLSPRTLTLTLTLTIWGYNKMLSLVVVLLAANKIFD